MPSPYLNRDTQKAVAVQHFMADRGEVEYDNTAARRLYERAGFTELCRYH
jgi:ribosomal protein S18 acetylase RimI-like enzyme